VPQGVIELLKATNDIKDIAGTTEDPVIRLARRGYCNAGTASRATPAGLTM
jgi:hypothetical protein